MPKSMDEISALMAARRSADAPAIQRMQKVLSKVEGDVAVALTDVKGEPEGVPPVAQIVADAIEFNSQKAAGQRPIISVPALDLAKETGVRSRQYASVRRRALYATWYDNALVETSIRRAYRQYFGYGTFSLIAMPDFETKSVSLELRDPLTAYPELRTPDDIRPPRNIGFVFGRSSEWIARHYPEAANMVQNNNTSEDRMWDMVEWIDEDDIVIGILGPRYSAFNTQSSNAGWAQSYQSNMELRRWPNRAGMVPAATPRRVTLGSVMGQVYAAVGQQTALEKFTALEIAAAEKYVFPDVVVLGRDGRTPMLVSGAWKDGRTGEANFIQDGDVKMLNAAPGVMTMPTIDRIQENAQRTAGLVPYAFGQTYGALRTGRAIDSLGSYAVDPRIQEAHEVVARSLATLNEGIINVYKGYFPKKKFVLFSGWPGDQGHVEFTPEVHLETPANVVSYPFPGSDVSEVGVSVGQLVSLRLMSRRTGRNKHPWIEDGDQEGSTVLSEQLEDSLLQSLLQQAQSGQLPLIDMAIIDRALAEGKPLRDAVLEADEAARRRQAAAASTPEPGAALPAEAVPGLAMPGQGAEALVPANEALNPTGAPPQGIQDAAQLFRALRAGMTRG